MGRLQQYNKHCAHLKEAIVSKKKRGAVDAKVENTVMTRGDVQAHSRSNELHSLAALNLQHSAHRSHHDLQCRSGQCDSLSASLKAAAKLLCSIHCKPPSNPELCKLC